MTRTLNVAFVSFGVSWTSSEGSSVVHHLSCSLSPLLLGLDQDRSFLPPTCPCFPVPCHTAGDTGSFLARRLEFGKVDALEAPGSQVETHYWLPRCV